MILILILILNNSSVGHTRAELNSKPTAIPCQNNAILSVDYKLSIILGRRRPEQWRGWDGKVFTNKARWKYAYCIEGRQVEYKCGLLTQYLSMNFATWWCSTTLYNVLNDAFQAVIAFIVPISFNLVPVLQKQAVAHFRDSPPKVCIGLDKTYRRNSSRLIQNRVMI